MARIARTKADLIRLLDASRATVYRWLKAGAPQRPDGAWDADEVQAWADERYQRAQVRSADIRHGNVEPGKPEAEADGPAADLGEDGPPRVDSLRQARLQETQVRTAERWFALQMRKGQFVERGKVAEMLTNRMAALKRRCTQAARTIAVEVADIAEVDPLVIEEMTEKVLLDMLREIYGKVPADLVA